MEVEKMEVGEGVCVQDSCELEHGKMRREFYRGVGACRKAGPL
jgi:hypothetical protein